MPSYRVCFFYEVPRNGRLFHCCQRSIVIRSARNGKRAIEAAKKRFERCEGVRDWRIRAAAIGAEEIKPLENSRALAERAADLQPE